MTNSITKLFNIFLLGVLIVVSTGSIIVSKSLTHSEKLIYVDPGHGGRDGGAETTDGVYEKDIVMAISIKLQYLLSQAGYKVVLTRNGDYDLASEGSKNRKREDIYKRVDLINNSNCLLYISIHANIYPNKSVHGAQTFYNKNNPHSKDLAEEIQSTIKDIIQNTHMSSKSINGKYLVEHVERTGCLVEVGFLSNYNEASLLKDRNYQEKMAYAIYIGVCSFLEKN